MEPMDHSIENLIHSLRERAKELNCLYRVDEILGQADADLNRVADQLIEAIPPGWQYPEICRARLVIGGAVHAPPGFVPTPWMQSAPILALGEPAGEIEVYYLQEKPASDEGPFLREERKLIHAIADRIGLFLVQQRARGAHQSLEDAVQEIAAHERAEWTVVIDLLRRTDPRLLARITRKMINHLGSLGVKEANEVLQRMTTAETLPGADENQPLQRTELGDQSEFVETAFSMAAARFSEAELVETLRTWLEEDKSIHLINALENPYGGLTTIAEAIARFEGAGVVESRLPLAVRRSLRVALVRRIFSDEFAFLAVAKDHVRVSDFYGIFSRMIHPAQSHGKLGGKSTGLFLAWQVIQKAAPQVDVLGKIRVPRTWYLTSDTLLHFMHFNNLEDLYDRKYQEVERIRQEYPHVVQVFKNSRFPPDIVKGLAVVLDEFEDRPLIVRSSSLLEDRVGSAFSGKYKSLFLANQGSKQQRLNALQDAIAEVYASVFGPDPIEYRAQMGLLDVHEEMAILVQEVVGQRVGKYFFPAFAGVAFSNNEFRWSERIRREDGLVRMVPGLGTRAVDRLADDYPVLWAPGQSGLRVNVSADEIVHYAPRMMDVIDLEQNALVTVEVRRLLAECRDEVPALRQMISIVDHDRIRPPTMLEPDWSRDQCVVTFQGLADQTPFMSQMRQLLSLLRQQLGTPVDIEFACDGKDFYLLQCRAQSYSESYAPSPIPRHIPRERLVFSANRFISNGRVPDLTHIVYVVPERYAQLTDVHDLQGIGRAVGRLNKVLPRRQFALMGPGRWGSRGDIRLGVPVTYSDINNAAILIEIARKSGSYSPELSFGTHFFQDLVESDIRYIPLYPDEEGVVFHEEFLTRSTNILAEIAPDLARLQELVRVIDVPRECPGEVLRVLMNADLDEAVGILSPPQTDGKPWEQLAADPYAGDSERWHLRLAERIAASLDAPRFGVQAMYLLGARAAAAEAMPRLSLVVHVRGTPRQREDLALWLEGWSRSLAAMNASRLGSEGEGLLDVQFLTDKEIEQKTPLAAEIEVNSRAVALGRRAR